MERLPTELILQILKYMSMEEVKVVGFISSRYRFLVLPLLFRRISPWSWMGRKNGTANLINCLQNNTSLSSVVRHLDAQSIKRSRQPVEEIRRIMELTTGWDELILPADDHIPLAVFDNNAKLKLRRLQVRHDSVDPKFDHLLLNILPACTNLVDLEIPQMEDAWFKSFDPVGSASVEWISRLEKYCGPSYPLNYLRESTPLYELTSKAEVPSQMFHRLSQLAGPQLLALHVLIYMIDGLGHRLTARNYLQPSLTTSLFPNLRYVAWFLIMSQSRSVRGNHGLPQTELSSDEATREMNQALFDAILQLHHLRRVWFTSEHSDNGLPECVSTFVEDMQKISLPYLRVITLWAPNSDLWSYSFIKEEVKSIKEGCHTTWACETNKSVYPNFD